MTTNVNQIDLLCFKGKIKNKLFNLNLTGKENIVLKNLLTNIKSMLKYNLINLRRRLHEKRFYNGIIRFNQKNQC